MEGRKRGRVGVEGEVRDGVREGKREEGKEGKEVKREGRKKKYVDTLSNLTMLII